jgi:segregation and condensation protein B
MQDEQLKQVVEVLVFASDIPLPADQIHAIVEEAGIEDIAKAVDELNADYRRTDRTFQIIHVGGGYQIVTHENYAGWVKKLFQGRLKTKLSQAAMEALSMVAFRQPVSKPEIEAIRGVNCDGVIRTLLERKLITISGRAEGQGKPLLYKTTKEFLRYFGVNDISDLPKPKEIEELFKGNPPQANSSSENQSRNPSPQEDAVQGDGNAPNPVSSEPVPENPAGEQPISSGTEAADAAQ